VNAVSVKAVAVITVSDSVSAGKRVDASGPAVKARLEHLGWQVPLTDVVPDDVSLISRRLIAAADAGQVCAIFTTGGTGISARDVTPEATRAVIERDAPGFAEAMRAESLRHTPLGILTRGVSGIAGRTLIVNFPGNPKAVQQLFGVLAPTLKHVVETLQRP
jgi:molybdenum cofactor synthesis domain-containing protein